MVKFVMCIRLHKDMTRDQFQDYWSIKHGPFFIKNAVDMRAKYFEAWRCDSALKVLTN